MRRAHTRARARPRPAVRGARAPRDGPTATRESTSRRAPRACVDLCGPSAEVMILRQGGFVTFYV